MSINDAIVKRRAVWHALMWATVVAAAPMAFLSDAASQPRFETIVRPDRPIQRDSSAAPAQPQLPEARKYIGVADVWEKYKVQGEGMTVAVLDTGLFSAHVDFDGGTRVGPQLNFTPDNGGRPHDAADGDGHGTNVAGIIAAGALNLGIAPKARVVPMKVLGNDGSGSFVAVRDALRWILAPENQKHRITVVNMSLGNGRNHTSMSGFEKDEVADLLRKARHAGIAVVAAAGNAYRSFQTEGMGYPAIVPETISVGAVYDADGGEVTYGDGAKALIRKPGHVTPFTQRFSTETGGGLRTDILAPGTPITSTGLKDPQKGISTQHGTSQASPVTSGVILLMQQWHSRQHAGRLPTVDQIEDWLRQCAKNESDADEEQTNVKPTRKSYRILNADAAFNAMQGKCPG